VDGSASRWLFVCLSCCVPLPSPVSADGFKLVPLPLALLLLLNRCPPADADLNVLNFVAPVLFAPIYGVPSGALVMVLRQPLLPIFSCPFLLPAWLHVHQRRFQGVYPLRQHRPS
jgi:hypothetical protein